jgi:cell wall-associated NlpC family hydrolase
MHFGYPLCLALAASIALPPQSPVRPPVTPPAAPPANEGDLGYSEQVDETRAPHAIDGAYKSPYRITLHHEKSALLFDADTARARVAEESSVSELDWYSAAMRKRYGGWGVPQRQFDSPHELRDKPAEWKRERVVAAAARFIGYEYQHHHVPDWNPPADWPWNSCCAGKQGKGVDCSNFSGWNYNWALGIHLTTDVHKQAAETTARTSEGEVRAEVIKRPAGSPDESYAELCKTLKPGDLLYITDDKQTHVSHVIMWLGDCASSPDGTPLVLDSTGGKVQDCEGHAIPCGIHIRPFAKGSWYHRCFSHAHRWING